jgi:ferredoxin
MQSDPPARRAAQAHGGREVAHADQAAASVGHDPLRQPAQTEARSTPVTAAADASCEDELRHADPTPTADTPTAGRSVLRALRGELAAVSAQCARSCRCLSCASSTPASRTVNHALHVLGLQPEHANRAVLPLHDDLSGAVLALVAFQVVVVVVVLVAHDRTVTFAGVVTLRVRARSSYERPRRTRSAQAPTDQQRGRRLRLRESCWGGEAGVLVRPKS